MKIPKPRKLPSGSWFIQLRIGGESVPITAYTERECIRAAELIKAEHRNGKRAPEPTGASLTLREAVDNYINARDSVLSPATICGYTVIQNNRFKTVMDKKIKDITDWQAVCNEEAKLCSAKTLTNAWMFIASVIKEATDAAAPKVTLPQVVAKERSYLTPTQILSFIEAVKGQSCELPALLALHSLRKSEIYGLQWDRFDFDKNTIEVRGAAVYDKNSKLVPKKENKNAASRRRVPIMIPRLLDVAKAQKEAGLAVSLCTPNALWKQINRVCRLHDLPEVGVHGLRHSFASLAYHLQMPEKIAMQIGGWANQSTMHKIYTHLSQEDITKYENKMTEFFKNANENANENKKASDGKHNAA